MGVITTLGGYIGGENHSDRVYWGNNHSGRLYWGGNHSDRVYWGDNYPERVYGVSEPFSHSLVGQQIASLLGSKHCLFSVPCPSIPNKVGNLK